MTRYTNNQFDSLSNSALLVTIFQLQQRGSRVSAFRLARELGASQQQVRIGLVRLAQKGLVSRSQLTWKGLAAACALASAALATPAEFPHAA